MKKKFFIFNISLIVFGVLILGVGLQMFTRDDRGGTIAILGTLFLCTGFLSWILCQIADQLSSLQRHFISLGPRNSSSVSVSSSSEDLLPPALKKDSEKLVSPSKGGPSKLAKAPPPLPSASSLSPASGKNLSPTLPLKSSSNLARLPDAEVPPLPSRPAPKSVSKEPFLPRKNFSDLSSPSSGPVLTAVEDVTSHPDVEGDWLERALAGLEEESERPSPLPPASPSYARELASEKTPTPNAGGTRAFWKETEEETLLSALENKKLLPRERIGERVSDRMNERNVERSGEKFAERASERASERSTDLAKQESTFSSRPAIQEEPSMVGRYEAGGAHYVLFSDGKIEVEMSGKTYRFHSMEELKKFIANKEKLRRAT